MVFAAPIVVAILISAPQTARVEVSGVKKFALDDSIACALTVAGEVYCWQLVLDVESNKFWPPELLEFSEKALDVTVSGTVACVSGESVTRCWHFMPYRYQMPNPYLTKPPVKWADARPFEVRNLKEKYSDIVGSNGLLCGRNVQSQTNCWRGSDVYNVMALSQQPIRSLALGANIGCFIDQANYVNCFVPAEMATGRPTRITKLPQMSNAVQVDVGSQHACVLRQSGQVLCWGAVPFFGVGRADFSGSVRIDVSDLGLCADLKTGRYCDSPWLSVLPHVDFQTLRLANKVACYTRTDGISECTGLMPSLYVPDTNRPHPGSLGTWNIRSTMGAGIRTREGVYVRSFFDGGLRADFLLGEPAAKTLKFIAGPGFDLRTFGFRTVEPAGYLRVAASYKEFAVSVSGGGGYAFRQGPGGPFVLTMVNAGLRGTGYRERHTRYEKNAIYAFDMNLFAALRLATDKSGIREFTIGLESAPTMLLAALVTALD